MIHQAFTVTTQNDQTIEIGGFATRHKLRSHTVYHYSNSYEAARWAKLCSDKNNAALMVVDKLKDLGCQFFDHILQPERPPCHRCKLWNRCTPIISELEQNYQHAIKQSCCNAIELPRYLSFTDKETNEIAQWFLCDNRILTKTLHNDAKNHFTVKTSFAIQQLNGWASRHRYIVKRAKKQAHLSIVDPINAEHWNLEDSTTKHGHKNKKNKSTISKKMAQPKKYNWRNQLDDMYDE